MTAPADTALCRVTIETIIVRIPGFGARPEHAERPCGQPAAAVARIICRNDHGESLPMCQACIDAFSADAPFGCETCGAQIVVYTLGGH
jgi:hypothetical protein